MVKAMSLSNFRAFEHLGPIPLKLLTCIVGRSSSGKSSVLNALLLLKQGSEERVVGSRIAQLNLNGPYYDAGSYAGIVRQPDEKKKEIGFTFEVEVDRNASAETILYRSSLVQIDVPRPAIGRYR